MPKYVIEILCALSIVGCLSSCVTTRIVTKPVPDCKAWSFVTVADADILTDPTARQIVENDKNWLRLCGSSKAKP